jgi:hypothetical protein
MNAIEVGRYIGLGSSNKIDLWCRIFKIEKDSMHVRIINGEWDGIYSDHTLTCCFYPESQIEIKSEFLLPIPNFQTRYYNEAINWMNGELTENIDQFLETRLPKANFDDYDDDIPF